MSKRRIVIKLSGSAFAAESIAGLAGYARALRAASRFCQPLVVAGGGPVARVYIDHARSAGADESTLDEIGIDVSRLNARLLIHELGGAACAHPPRTLREVDDAAASGRIVVAGGLYPGQSTNGTAALIAERVRASLFLNATDVDGVYDRDPKKHARARRLRRVTAAELRSMLAAEDSAAGAYDLLDIISLKVIERSQIRTRVILASPRSLASALAGRASGTEIVTRRARPGSGRSRSRPRRRRT